MYCHLNRDTDMAKPNLPYPRLELRWRTPTIDERANSGVNPNWACDYLLVLHKANKGDMRCEGPRGGAGKVDVEVLMETSVMSGPDPFNPKTGEVETPYRNGAHAQWDAMALDIPAYATCGNYASKVEIR